MEQIVKNSHLAEPLVALPPLKINEIHLGDSFSLCERVPDKAVSVILEDMNYNTTKCEWDVEIDLELYWKTRLRILKPTGVLVLTASQPFTTDLINSNRKMFKYEWIWERDRVSGFLNANKMPMKAHENVCVFYNEQPTYNPIKTKGNPNHGRGRAVGNKANGGTYGDFTVLENIEDTKFPRTVQYFPRPFPNIHETQKPVGLFEYLIRTYTNEGDLVFDGFGGSGTTAIAAHKSKRNFIVIEKEQKYFDLATRRLDIERAQLTIF